MKIMAVDFGDSRTGIACCDKSEMLASPVCVINERDFEECIKKTARTAVENKADIIVVGYPKNMNNTLGDRAEKCQLFAEKLKELTGKPVELWDERNTTVSAHNYLNVTNTRGKKRKAVVDAVAATIILESYMGYRKNSDYVRQVINLTQTTSGSYLLISSLDIARKNLALNGKSIFKKTVQFAEYARNEINKLGGYYAFGNELCDNNAFFDFDKTKLSVHTRDIGLAGIEVYDILRDDYGIQIEFGDIGNILAIISAGDRALEIERLISSLSEIKRLYSKDKTGMFDHEYINPEVITAPQKAFYSNKKSVPINQSSGMVCGEFVMCYPPGIPILAPGEKITDEIINYINYAKEKGCFMTGTQDMKIENINVVEDK